MATKNSLFRDYRYAAIDKGQEKKKGWFALVSELAIPVCLIKIMAYGLADRGGGRTKGQRRVC